MGIEEYKRLFGNLKRGSTQYGIAPHKPIFLLSFLDFVGWFNEYRNQNIE